MDDVVQITVYKTVNVYEAVKRFKETDMNHAMTRESQPITESVVVFLLGGATGAQDGDLHASPGCHAVPRISRSRRSKPCEPLMPPPFAYGDVVDDGFLSRDLWAR
ncbi:hypothetical protein GWI33_000148 [Rhynchophorus ferrugineus]|uniref:Uncharacterized protein n=1 Tax=Rhynchophorus ferrugineus TaxID=354439 RepID=A0A834IX91_RHYFE|nr:hypothetical protein GWI33_000148 [Rhynchophorus ferrugineus]